MINGGYLIPANTKKGQLIAGYFTPKDLMIAGIGLGSTLLLLIIFGTSHIIISLFSLFPLLIAAFLVAPIPNYLNVRTFFKSMFEYINSQKEYEWRGWCVYESEKR